MIALLLLSAWLLTDLVATYGVIHYRRGLGTLPPAQDAPRVVLLIPIKGVSGTTAQFLDALCRQRYPAYRLVFALESPSDPVVGLIEGLHERLASRLEIEVVIAGQSVACAQKIHNLLAALHRLRDDDRLVVFADADILPDEAWLSTLIRPVANHEFAASSGYRWQLPTDRRWPSLIAAAIDLSVATAARSVRWNLCWGGSTAIDRAALNQLDLPAVWSRAASDDLTLTAALRSRGIKIKAPLHALVPSPAAYRWTSLFGFARRQYLLVRIYAPRHWLLAGWTLCLPTVAVITAIRLIFDGHWWASSFMIASIVFLQMRLLVRRAIADRLLPPSGIAAAKATICFAQWAWPLIHLVNLGAYVASLAGRRFTWAGTRYRFRGRTISIEDRPAA